MAIDNSIIEQEMKKAQSLVEFRNAHLAGPKDVESPDFHHRWSHILLRGREHYAIEGFRESGKDQVVFQANIMHALTYPVDYRSYILMIGANWRDMSTKLKDITRQWQSPEHDGLRINVQKIVEDSGDAFEVSYKNGKRVRIEVYGKGGMVRGRVWGVKRPDIIIINDMQDPSDMDSDITPEKDWDWFLGDILFLGRSSRIFMIGNNIGARCVIERVMAHANALNFKTMRIGIADYLKDDGMDVEVGTPTWPQRHTREEILAEYLSFKSIGKEDHYMREKMCVNMAPLSHPLHPEKMIRFDWHDPVVIEDIKNTSVSLVVDPALSKKKTADPSVILAFADVKGGKRYILDIDFRKRDPNELIDDLLRMVGKWNPVSVGIETVAYQQALVVMLKNEMEVRTIKPEAFRVVEIRTKQNKNLKISGRLQPMLEAGQIFVPKGASWLPALVTQMGGWPDGEHDDMLDAMSMADDVKIDRLVHTFSSQNCVIDTMKIPSNWPRWASMAARADGEVVMLFLVCSPEGKLYVTDEIKGIYSPAELYIQYQKVLSGRRCNTVFAPKEMFDPDPITGNVWAGNYISVGIPLCPGADMWKVLIAEMIEQFDSPKDGATPRLKVFRGCEELIWELSSSIRGDEGRETIIALRCLMMILGHRPSWQDMTNPDRYGEKANYPAADIP